MVEHNFTKHVWSHSNMFCCHRNICFFWWCSGMLMCGLRGGADMASGQLTLFLSNSQEKSLLVSTWQQVFMVTTVQFHGWNLTLIIWFVFTCEMASSLTPYLQFPKGPISPLHSPSGHYIMKALHVRFGILAPIELRIPFHYCSCSKIWTQTEWFMHVCEVITHYMEKSMPILWHVNVWL